MPDRAGSENLPVHREGGDIDVRNEIDGLSPCPSCGRLTATVGRGACADCWQAKMPDGEPVVRPVEPKTLPLLGPIGDVPDWVWLALASAVGGLVAGLVYLL